MFIFTHCCLGLGQETKYMNNFPIMKTQLSVCLEGILKCYQKKIKENEINKIDSSQKQPISRQK